jgi:hypothetical protein
MAAHYVGHQSLPSAANARALRSLLVEGQHNEALAALLPSTRSPARRGTPRRSLSGAPGRRVELLAAIAPRELMEAIVSGRPHGEWRVGGLRARLLLVSGTCLSVDLERLCADQPPGTRTALNLPRLWETSTDTR